MNTSLGSRSFATGSLFDQRGAQPAQVTASWLAAPSRQGRHLRIIDLCRVRSGGSVGVLPSAIALDWEVTFSAPPTTCPNPLVLASVMSRLGVSDEHTIVLYDEGHGARALPGYRWLRRYGLQRVFILRGGKAEWARLELGLQRSPTQFTVASFTTKIGNDWSHQQGPIDSKESVTELG